LSPPLFDLIVFSYLYGGLDARPILCINTEFTSNDGAIFRVGDVQEHGITLHDFKHPMIF